MQDISAKLKAKREELGYRLEEVVEKTKLHPSALHDIEEGNLSNISPAYLRGFLRIYAKFLGVDIDMELRDVPSVQNVDKKPKPTVTKIPVQKPVVTPIRQPIPSVPKPTSVKTVINLKTSESSAPVSSVSPTPAQKPWVKPHASVQEAPEPRPMITLSLPSQVVKSIAIAIAAVLLLVVVGKIVPAAVQNIRTNHAIAVQKAKIKKIEYERKRAVEKDKKNREKTRRVMEKKRIQAQKDAAKKEKEFRVLQEKTSKVSAASGTTSASVAVPLPQTKSKDVTVSVTTKKDCFVRANVDGRVLFEGVLRKGVAETWKAKKEIDLKISDGSAVIVEVNGSVVPPLSTSPRAIKSVKINSKGISVNK